MRFNADSFVVPVEDDSLVPIDTVLPQVGIGTGLLTVALVALVVGSVLWAIAGSRPVSNRD